MNVFSFWFSQTPVECDLNYTTSAIEFADLVTELKAVRAQFLNVQDCPEDILVEVYQVDMIVRASVELFEESYRAVHQVFSSSTAVLWDTCIDIMFSLRDLMYYFQHLRTANYERKFYIANYTSRRLEYCSAVDHADKLQNIFERIKHTNIDDDDSCLALYNSSYILDKAANGDWKREFVARLISSAKPPVTGKPTTLMAKTI